MSWLAFFASASDKDDGPCHSDAGPDCRFGSSELARHSRRLLVQRKRARRKQRARRTDGPVCDDRGGDRSEGDGAQPGGSRNPAGWLDSADIPNCATLEDWPRIFWRGLADSDEVLRTWGVEAPSYDADYVDDGDNEDCSFRPPQIGHSINPADGRHQPTGQNGRTMRSSIIAHNGYGARTHGRPPVSRVTGPRRHGPLGGLVSRAAACLVLASRAGGKQEIRLHASSRLPITPSFTLPPSHLDMTTMDDTVCDIWAPSDLGFADLFDNGHDDAYDLDFGDSSPRVKLPSTAPLDPDTELKSTEMEDTWALGSPLKGRAPLTRTASIEFAMGKMRGLKRDASLDKIFVSPMNMETWGEDSGASAATDASAAPAPATPTASAAAASPIVAPPVHVVTAPPAVAPAAPVTASAAPTMPETAPAPPKNKNNRKGAQKKGRTAQAEEDAKDDAAATAQSNPKTTQSNPKTARSAGTTQRQRSTKASTKAPAASSQAPSASARASTSTARAIAADGAAPYALKATSRAARRAAKVRRAMQSLIDADIEDALGADATEATSASAFGNTNAITKDAANLTPSPTRTPPPSASMTAPALAPAGALDRVAASPQKALRQGKGHATEAQADVDEHTTATNDNKGSNLCASVDVAKNLQAVCLPPTDHVEPAPQLPAALMQNTLAQPLAHYTPPAPAHGHLIAQVPQSGDAASRIRAHAPGDVRLTPARVQDMHDIEAAFWPPTAPTHHQLFVPAPWYHNVVLAAQPHAMFNGQPMLPTTMPAPLPTMIAPPMQYPTNAPAPAIGLHAQQVSSTQYGPWVPPSHPTSIEPPAPAPYYNVGAPSTQASGQAYPPMRAASGALSSRAGTYVDGNGMARAISPLPQRALASTSSSAAESQPRTNAYASGHSHLGSQAISSAARSAPTIDLPESVMKVLRNNSKYAAPIAQLQRLSAPVNPLAGAASDEPYRVVTGMKRKGQFSASQSVDCQYDHGAGHPEYCGHSFVLDCSEAELMKRVLDHLGFSRLERKRCCWNGCLLTQTYQCNQLGLGHHILEKHFPKDYDGAPAPKHARHH
ncbi:uncharacterized protein SCHCODRAFT_02673855 [Schizophyllum commune H4-8]|uniref:uncharacterized protein n=1 Tax=Schizophyllum commune (strain H4-8 / FGSC 9210) TaxID=578458 RepID=UPI00215F32AF|nr:uncharacterized protein SCHCODRAFT_02673855 [Schizophyllum commune H4-8]KAI5884841.1 hypothetical protein SCHCODRAFT_02673855 [Schizophyllum commune H4-8]